MPISSFFFSAALVFGFFSFTMFIGLRKPMDDSFFIALLCITPVCVVGGVVAEWVRKYRINRLKEEMRYRLDEADKYRRSEVRR